MTIPSTRPDRLIVVADHAPGIHITDSEDVWWWLPAIGPASSLLAFTLARHARQGDTTWVPETLARMLGLGGNRCRLWASVDRLAGFGLVTFVATDVITVRLELPQMTVNQLGRLPDDLAAGYRQHLAGMVAV